MDIGRAKRIVAQDDEVKKKEAILRKVRYDGHYNHFVKLIESHKYYNDDKIESFFEEILDANFVKKERMPQTWKSVRTYAESFRSLCACLKIPQINKHLLEVMSRDKYDEILNKCNDNYISYRMNHEEESVKGKVENESKGTQTEPYDDGSKMKQKSLEDKIVSLERSLEEKEKQIQKERKNKNANAEVDDKVVSLERKIIMKDIKIREQDKRLQVMKDMLQELLIAKGSDDRDKVIMKTALRLSIM
ncbi:MAG: hypothetical protein ACK5XN_18185 [Bacteroidota bacterium]